MVRADHAGLGRFDEARIAPAPVGFLVAARQTVRESAHLVRPAVIQEPGELTKAQAAVFRGEGLCRLRSPASSQEFTRRGKAATSKEDAGNQPTRRGN
jgi:hypothetical protein